MYWVDEGHASSGCVFFFAAWSSDEGWP
jgi:hypothetical protein